MQTLRSGRIFPIGKMASKPEDPIVVRSAKVLGDVVRETRQQARLDQETAAGLTGVGVRFLGDVERGKPTVRLALVLQVLERLGLELVVRRRGRRA